MYFQHASGDLSDLGRLMLDQGCRPEELLRLRREDVDLFRREIRIRTGKTQAARRTLDLTTESLSILARRLASNSEWVFPSRRRPWTHAARMNSQHDAALWRANHDRSGAAIDPPVAFVLYDLRHTFATRFAAQCPNIEVLMRILGHSQSRMVFRYVHPTREAQRQATAVFDAAMLERQKQVTGGLVQ